MPAHNSFRSDQRNSPEDRGKPPIQLDEEQAVAVRKVDATAHLASQYNQLMPERGILRFKSALRLERRGQQRQKETKQRDHRGRR